MYCRFCQLHFSGAHTEGRCPNCGRSAESTPAEGGISMAPEPKPLHETAPASPPRAPPPAEASRPAPEPTRAENLPPGVWAKGTVVAGKYEVLRRVGSGGFGTVYQVRHLQRKKLYAMKIPHPEYLREEVFMRRFEREIEALERFVHPDVVPVRDSGITPEGMPYFTMDFIEGESLRRVLGREGVLDLKRAMNIILRILQVLEVAHKNQIIHRDIKPDNILLGREEGREVIKVLDFGIAKLLDLVGNASTITHGVRVGTPKYMSPEQITGEAVDGRSDLFAVGILFYEMVTGRHPFGVEQDPIRTTGNILSREPVNPRELRPEIPRALAEKILWLLEKKPRKRPQSAAEVLGALSGLEMAVTEIKTSPEQVRLYPGSPRLEGRRPVTSLVLSRSTAEGMQRCFLLFKEVVNIGRSNDPRRGLANDLILRRLPCRSREQDPDNWKLNLTISHRAASIRTEGTAVVIEPAAESAYGIAIGGVRSKSPARIQSDRFHLSLGDRALEIDGYRLLRDLTRKPLDLSFLLPQDAPGAAGKIGYSSARCLIDAMVLTREGNCPLHSYYLVRRQLIIGSGSEADLRIPEAPGVEGRHATLIYESGEIFLLPVQGRVGILPARGERLEAAAGGAVTPSRREEILLKPGLLYPIAPGATIILGDVRFDVEETQEKMFKEI
ncbi:MAG: serine/threonine protein kinase [Planctomycetes bacterium]|nr:serine/threonine protein kinase [Planctomycetota bacterium]